MLAITYIVITFLSRRTGSRTQTPSHRRSLAQSSLKRASLENTAAPPHGTTEGLRPNNTLTLSYDLNGRYTTFTGTVGLVDSPFNRDPMQLTLLGDGRTLGSALLTPGGLPASFKVSVARVRQLTIRLSNVSGAAPNLITACCYQYAPGAVLIANPRLAG